MVDHTCTCGGRLTFDYPFDALRDWHPVGEGLSRFLPLLPVGALSADMGEGGTPLVESRRLGPVLGVRLFFKLESLNPTGSYKDRFASVGAAVATAHGRTALAATSSGNAGAAIAAYAVRAGLRAILIVPEEAPPAKLLQIRSYGATLITIRGALSRAGSVARMFQAIMEASAQCGWLPMITAHRYAPAAMEGVKTLAFETVEALGRAPDRVYVPVGGGGLLAATWRGFVQAHAMGWTQYVPRMIAVQPEGCAPVVHAVMGQMSSSDGVITSISGLQVADPPDGEMALAALSASGGSAVALSDSAIYTAQQRLAGEEAVFAEPAAAAALGGVLADASVGRLRKDETVVCLVTGSGFKDPAPLAIPDPLPVLDVSELDRLVDVAGDLMARSRASTSQV